VGTDFKLPGLASGAAAMKSSRSTAANLAPQRMNRNHTNPDPAVRMPQGLHTRKIARRCGTRLPDRLIRFFVRNDRKIAKP